MSTERTERELTDDQLVHGFASALREFLSKSLPARVHGHEAMQVFGRAMMALSAVIEDLCAYGGTPLAGLTREPLDAVVLGPCEREVELANQLCMELCFTPDDGDDRRTAERYLAQYRAELQREHAAEVGRLRRELEETSAMLLGVVDAREGWKADLESARKELAEERTILSGNPLPWADEYRLAEEWVTRDDCTAHSEVEQTAIFLASYATHRLGGVAALRHELAASRKELDEARAQSRKQAFALVERELRELAKPKLAVAIFEHDDRAGNDVFVSNGQGSAPSNSLLVAVDALKENL